MKIICIGCNYTDHIKEFEAIARPASPLFFIKPDTAMLRNNDPFYLPDFSSQVDYECELIVKITRVVKSIEQRFAHRCYDEVGLGIDFTARDIQREAMAKGLPWELAKGFDHSAAISPRFIPLSEIGGEVQNLHFELELNGEVRQVGLTRDMLFSVDEIISYVSQFVTLKIGDLIFTGTPAGIGKLTAGDNIKCRLEGQELLNFDVR